MDDGRYAVRYADGAPLHNPGLFQGIAGIGYHLLSTATDVLLPSVLLLS